MKVLPHYLFPWLWMVPVLQLLIQSEIHLSCLFLFPFLCFVSSVPTLNIYFDTQHLIIFQMANLIVFNHMETYGYLYLKYFESVGPYCHTLCCLLKDRLILFSLSCFCFFLLLGYAISLRAKIFWISKGSCCHTQTFCFLGISVSFASLFLVVPDGFKLFDTVFLVKFSVW